MTGPLRFDTEDEWLSWRQPRLGGSLIGAVLGVHPYTTPLAAYHQLIGLTEDKPDTLAMRLGRLGQRLVAQTWVDDYDTSVDFYGDVEEGEAFTHPDNDRLACTLDYRVVDGDLVEVKITGGRWEDGPPAHVEAQARWQLGIVNANSIPADTCHVVRCTVPGWRIQSWPITHDQALFDTMRAAAEGFLNNHVDKRIPPRAILGDLDTLTATAGTDASPLIATGQAAAELEAAALDYFDRNARARETQKDADEAKAVLYQLLGDHTDAWIEGDTDRRALVSVSRRSRVNVSTKGMAEETFNELDRLGHITRSDYPTLKVVP